MNNPKLAHEPALLEDGTPYRPYVLDDSQQLQGFQAYLCRHCHCYYSTPDTEPLFVVDPVRYGTDTRDFPAELEGSSVCPAKLYEALKGVAL